jgi:hypothetical protein
MRKTVADILVDLSYRVPHPASFVGWDFGPDGAWVMPAGATLPVLKWRVAGALQARVEAGFRSSGGGVSVVVG